MTPQDKGQHKRDIRAAALKVAQEAALPEKATTEALVDVLLDQVADLLAWRESAPERILSLEEAAEETPWSASTFYRIAKDETSPFWKQGGRWVTTRRALVEWAEHGEHPQTRQPYQDPMPRTGRKRFQNVLAEAERRRRERGNEI